MSWMVGIIARINGIHTTKYSFRERIHKAIFNINVKTSSFDAEIVTELILSGVAHQIVQEKKRLAEEANVLYQNCFSNINTNEHPFSYHRWLPIDTNQINEQIEAGFENQGIRIFHSDRFLCSRSEKRTYFRVSLASADSMQELAQGLGILRTYRDEQKLKQNRP